MGGDGDMPGVRASSGDEARVGDERFGETGPAAGPRPRSARRRRPVSQHLLTLLVLAVTLALTGALALVSRDVIREQERRLLHERTGELAAFLASSTSDTVTVLRAAGAAAVDSGGPSSLFATITQTQVANGSAVVVAQRRGAAFDVIAAAGKTAPNAGDAVGPKAAQVAARALAGGGTISGIFTSAGDRHLVLVQPVRAEVPTVVYLETVLVPSAPAPTDPDSPYRELNVALYAAPTPSPDTLAIVSGDVPDLGSTTDTKPFPVGDETWLVVVSARQPLVGALASALPWVVLGAGLLLALMLVLIVEILARRRAYALRLVEERTRSLREAQLAAEKANRAKSEFLSRMSHELRTPLNAVLGFGQLLELDDLTPDQTESVAAIIRGGRHLLDLVNEILDINRIESGQLSLSPEAVLVSDVVSDAAGLVRPLAEGRQVNLLGAESGCAKYVFADRQRFKQILLNLLGNGIKYNRHGGSVSISCFEPVRGRLRVQVTDTGPGIPPEQFDLLFKPFERLGAERTPVEGTGIGLALSKGLAEAMGGTLGVESTVGRGSTFWLEFPLVEGPVERYERAAQATAVEAHEPEPGTLTVLHIEDNLANVDLVERVLAQRPGMRVLPAMQGRLGLDLAREHLPMLILLDLNLADLPGVEVLRMLREDPMTADIPVAIISADAMPRQVQRLMSSGAVAYLTKPIDVLELLRLVDDAAASRLGTGAGTGQPPGSVADPEPTVG